MNKLVARLTTVLDPSAPIPMAIGLALLAPFVILAAIVVVDGPAPLTRDTAARVMLGYGALVLSFLGGVRWGMTIRLAMGRREILLLAASLVPMLVAWLAIYLPTGPALGLLAVAYAAQGAWDVWAIEAGYGPPWYGRLRILFTLAVTALLAGSLIVLGNAPG